MEFCINCTTLISKTKSSDRNQAVWIEDKVLRDKAVLCKICLQKGFALKMKHCIKCKKFIYFCQKKGRWYKAGLIQNKTQIQCPNCKLKFCNLCRKLPSELFFQQKHTRFCIHNEKKINIWKRLFYYIFMLIVLPILGFFSNDAIKFRQDQQLFCLPKTRYATINFLIKYFLFFTLFYPIIIVKLIIKYVICIIMEICALINV